MTQTHTSRNLIAASAFGAVTAIIMFAQAGQANAATNVLNCEGSSRSAVMACCEQRVVKHGMPLWMRQAGANCKVPMIVKCVGYTVGAAANKYCKISKIHFEGGKGGKEKGGRDNGGRDNGGKGSQTGKK